MEWFYLLLIGVLSFALVYIAVQARVSSTIEKKLNAYYKSQIQGDMQEFYREMESHAAILDSRVGRFKKLIERQEENLQAWEKIYQGIKGTKNGKEMSRLAEEFQELKKELLSTELKLQARLEGIAGQGSGKSSPSPAAVTTQAPVAAPKSPKTTTPPPLPKTAAKTARRARPPAPAPTIQPESQPGDLYDELYDDLIDSMDSAYTPQKSPAPAKAVATPPSAGVSKESANAFTGILAAIGKRVMPLLEGAGGQTTAPPPAAPPQQFGSMLDRDLRKTTPDTKTQKAAPQPSRSSILREPVEPPPLSAAKEPQEPARARRDEIPPADLPAQEVLPPRPQAPQPEKRATEKESFLPDRPPPHSLEKKIDPESLIDLIERLRGPAGRPQALTNLLKSGFNVSQISELSGIPLSDLEMTRSIYNISAPSPDE